MLIKNQRQEEIIEFALGNEYFQTKEVLETLGEKFGVERLTIVRDLQKLKKYNILTQTGAGRSVHYSLEGL